MADSSHHRAAVARWLPFGERGRIVQSGKAAALGEALKRQLEGEVRFDPGARAMYAQDASHYRQVPVGVVTPRDAEDVERTLRVCRAYGAAVLMRGGGTSLAGQGCNLAVVLDTSRHMNRILEIDPERRVARIEPGVVLDDLRAAAEQHGLTFGPDPSTHAVCTLGGMIGNNACGVHSQITGRTSDNIESLDVLTIDGERFEVGQTDAQTLAQIKAAGGRRGEIYTAMETLRDEYAGMIRTRFPHIPRRVSGYNLDELLPERGFHVARALTGTEGTCAVVLTATVRLVPSPPVRVVVAMGYPDVAAAGDAVTRVLAHEPMGLEGTADSLIDNMRLHDIEAKGLKLLPEGGGWLFAEFGGDTLDEATDKAQRLIVDLAAHDEPPSMKLIDEPAQVRDLWAAREAAVGASARFADGTDTWPGWEDAAVPPDKLGDYLRDFQSLLEHHGYRATLYGHFGQGCVHARINFDLASDTGIARYRAFVEEAAKLVVRYGGSLSGEHGDGQSRAELLGRMFGNELVEAFARFKRIWDPENRLNPDKIAAPRALTDDLRLGADYTLPQLETHFQYPDDGRHFARAAHRCIGVGQCRRGGGTSGGGVMCPSYMVTREERHSTRGRARLLQELAEGRMPGHWRNEQVKEALDLCLACKGCKGECPAGVDVATYKAEFLAHHYKGRWRPRSAYAFGLVHQWARLGSLAPRLANAMMRMPGSAQLGQWLTGMSPQRQAPPFAAQTFRHWFARRPANGPASTHADPGTDAPTIILWPDTFHNHFHPVVLQAATTVLERAGCRVTLPGIRLCCGRPLYDFGMLDRAKAELTRVIEHLRPQLQNGTPIVGLEPSCVAVFRDEATNLFPDDPDAQRLRAQTFTLAEFLQARGSHFKPPQLNGTAIFHGHCHHRSIMGIDADLALLRSTGLEVQTPETGCCGMAGSFGYQREHAPLSIEIGERVLLPAVRAAEAHTRIVTDGFSCRAQITQCTPRTPEHLAQVLAS